MILFLCQVVGVSHQQRRKFLTIHHDKIGKLQTIMTLVMPRNEASHDSSKTNSLSYLFHCILRRVLTSACIFCQSPVLFYQTNLTFIIFIIIPSRSRGCRDIVISGSGCFNTGSFSVTNLPVTLTLLPLYFTSQLPIPSR